MVRLLSTSNLMMVVVIVVMMMMVVMMMTMMPFAVERNGGVWGWVACCMTCEGGRTCTRGSRVPGRVAAHCRSWPQCFNTGFAHADVWTAPQAQT